MTHLLLLMAGLGATHHHVPLATWERCSSRAGCRWYKMPRATHRPTGRTHFCTTSPTVTVCFTVPRFEPKPSHRTILPVKSATRTAPIIRATVQRVDGSYTRLMLVTYYLATGSPMANGIMPSVGWAACGYDLPLGARVSVPGVGVLTCGDRIGFQPWLHIDVYGVPLATGYREVTVLP